MSFRVPLEMLLYSLTHSLRHLLYLPHTTNLLSRMRMSSGEEGYWLPSEFLTDDDFLINKENFNNTQLDADFCFPTHTVHLLQKFRGMSTSPQPTPASLNGAKYEAVGDLIHLAAKLKLPNSCPPPQFRKQPEISTPTVYQNKSFENIGGRPVRGGMGHVGRDGSGAGGAAKKVCAGTGVFLPRRYDTISDTNSNAYSSAPRRRPASPSQVRGSVQIHTKPLVYRFVGSRPLPQLQPKIGRDFVSEHDLVLARRHALALLQQRRSFLRPVTEGSSMIGRRDHPCLPPEWTY